MTVDETQKMPKWRRLFLVTATLLGLFAGLCTVFALVVTIAEAWQEHKQAQWPEVSARIVQCGLHIYTHRRESYRIDCSVSYRVGDEENVAHVYSRSTPAPRRVIWQYPPRQFKTLEEWIDAHPGGTPITVHYDPTSHGKAVLVVTDMPLGGPRTPSNLRLLAAAAAGCVVLLSIARIARLRPAALGIGG